MDHAVDAPAPPPGTGLAQVLRAAQRTTAFQLAAEQVYRHGGQQRRAQHRLATPAAAGRQDPSRSGHGDNVTRTTRPAAAQRDADTEVCSTRSVGIAMWPSSRLTGVASVRTHQGAPLRGASTDNTSSCAGPDAILLPPAVVSVFFTVFHAHPALRRGDPSQIHSRIAAIVYLSITDANFDIAINYWHGRGCRDDVASGRRSQQHGVKEHLI